MNSTPDSEWSIPICEATGQPRRAFRNRLKDKAATGQFYAKLFDWKMAEMGSATMIGTGAGGIGDQTSLLGH